MDVPVTFSHLRHAEPKIRLKLVFRHQGCPLFAIKIWGTVTDMGKNFGGYVANIYLGKVMEAFKKFQAVLVYL